MNPVNFVQRKLAPIVNAAKEEIEHLRTFIQENERQIQELRRENIQLEEELANNQRLLAEKVEQVHLARRLLGQEAAHDEERLEDIARRLLASLSRSHDRIHELERQANEARSSLYRLQKKISILGWSVTGVTGTAIIGYSTYKIAKVYTAAQAGAIAGSALGATIGSPGGPLLLGTGAVGGVIGGISGAVFGLVTP